MLHACVQRFDTMGTVENFLKMIFCGCLQAAVAITTSSYCCYSKQKWTVKKDMWWTVKPNNCKDHLILWFKSRIKMFDSGSVRYWLFFGRCCSTQLLEAIVGSYCYNGSCSGRKKNQYSPSPKTSRSNILGQISGQEKRLLYSPLIAIIFTS